MFLRNGVTFLFDTRVSHSPKADVHWNSGLCARNPFLSVLWKYVSSLWYRLAGPPSWDFRPSVRPSQLNLKGRVVSL